MPRAARRFHVRIVLPEIDRVRWQGAADLAFVSLDRFIRDAVEAAIARREAGRQTRPLGCPDGGQ